MKQSRSLFLFCLLFISAITAFAQTPQNLQITKNALMQYHDSGAYLQEQRRVANHAQQYLEHRVQQNLASKNPKKLAVVFDIDETVLSNYASLKYLNFGGSLEQIECEIEKGNATVIAPTKSLYETALKKGVAVFFITSRHQYEKAITIKNLNREGFSTWQDLFLKPNRSSQTASEYKTAVRKKIAAEGYDVVLNIGDQESDLVGGYADRVFKLPNPYYLIP